MSTVVIGVDPHKRPATIEVMAADENVLGGGRYGPDGAGYAAMLARRGPVAGAGLGDRGLPGRRQVPGGPADRLCGAGDGRAGQAVGPDAGVHRRAGPQDRCGRCACGGAGRDPDGRAGSVADDAQLAVLRVLADRRWALGEDHTWMVCQLHQLLAELIPGRAKTALSAAQARPCWQGVRPQDRPGRPGDLERIYQRKKAAGKELTAALTATGTTLTSLEGIGPSGAARLLVEVADITRAIRAGVSAGGSGPGP
jgi:transposase